MGIAEILRLRPTGESRAASALYAAIVQQARDPAFFKERGVARLLHDRGIERACGTALSRWSKSQNLSDTHGFARLPYPALMIDTGSRRSAMSAIARGPRGLCHACTATFPFCSLQPLSLLFRSPPAAPPSAPAEISRRRSSSPRSSLASPTRRA